MAFVLLAYSTAYKAGINEAKHYIAETFELMENNFWSNEYELYSDEIISDWTQEFQVIVDRMRICTHVKLLIAAFEATNEQKYLG